MELRRNFGMGLKMDIKVRSEEWGFCKERRCRRMIGGEEALRKVEKVIEIGGEGD